MSKIILRSHIRKVIISLIKNDTYRNVILSHVLNEVLPLFR